MSAPSKRSVFIVRPFGTKEGIDFNAVQRDLLAPVLNALGFPHGTTEVLAHAGNIRADMLQQLLLADIVIADISIHNANVYYELGVRHALRDRATILIRCSAAEVPFDLKTDRYLAYDKENPKAAQDQLRVAIEATIARDGIDSPVFQLVPEAKPHDIAVLAPVPRDFREAAARAAKLQDAAQLLLMAGEVSAKPWRIQALGLLGLALFNLKADKAAIVTYKRIRDERPDDPEANLRLATLFERNGDMASSDAALARVDAQAGISLGTRRESLALSGRNRKTEWVASWLRGQSLAERQRAALNSEFLGQSRSAYRKGFLIDPGSYYAGLNALFMVAVNEQLALAQPEMWCDLHEDEGEAEIKLKQLTRDRTLLSDAVAFALEGAEACGTADAWLLVSKANHLLLTGASVKRVKAAYERVAGVLQEKFHRASEARQLTLLQQLGVFPEAVLAGLAALDFPSGVELRATPEPAGLVLLATGHRADAPGRTPPRLPSDAETQRRLKATLARHITEAKQGVRGPVRGIAALASGTDIVFHEVCAELGLPVDAYLPLPADDFKAESVTDGGLDWMRRFDERRNAASRVYELGLSKDPPSWVNDPNYGVFQRGNLWMLDAAFGARNANVVMLAVWDGEAAQGPGGTADMVAAANSRGANVRVIDPHQLDPI